MEPRDSSRLMILRRGDATIEHRVFRDIVDLLQPGDLLVCNESRVIPARLYGRRAETGGRVEVLLIAPRANNVWEALVKPGRRLRPGARIEFTRPDKPTGTPPFVPADPAPAAEHTDVVADVSRICHTAAVRRTLRCPPQVDSESASGPSRFTVRRTPDSFGGLRRSEDSFGEPHNRANAARRGRGGADASSAPPISLVGEIVDRAESGGRLIAFDGVENLEAALEELGAVPLPPYVHAPLSDAERYQTVFARIKGSVAAPTAGLHFTRDLMKIARDRGVTFAFVTLHIGLDTFRPVQVEDVAEHKMHTEFCELSPDVADEINTARAQGRRVVAVGTTSVRVLESAGRLAAEDPSLASHHTAVVKPFRGWTDIFIYPGHRFKAVDALITNFHLPRSTLLMLVSAFAGKDLIHRAYAEAIDRDYRFYSFGDCMLIL